MEPARVRPLRESDIDFAIEAAGGTRAHPDANRRGRPGADYRLGSAVIELKALDDEGFSKPERQAKLAALFRKEFPNSPVIVLDRRRLPQSERPLFDRIVEGPIKSGVAKASKQLKQSRLEHADTTCSVLFVLNNGYTTFMHHDLKELVAHRVRNDTREIDAVVVAGSYYHSDDFDGYFLWHIDCIVINLLRPFREFEKLHEGWDCLANRFMMDAVRGNLGEHLERGPVLDTQFDIDDVTYIRPAPAIGGTSGFYPHGRPRKDSSDLATCPAVATTFPTLTRQQWEELNLRLGQPARLRGSFEAWLAMQAEAMITSQPLKPLVTMPLALPEWERWCAGSEYSESVQSLFDFANDRFCTEVSVRLSHARERTVDALRPSRYVLVVTEVIGQDCANDISHIALVRERPHGEPLLSALVQDARIFHEHALALAAAYAVREGLEFVLWSKNLHYAWI
jgi:hypothetical protein